QHVIFPRTFVPASKSSNKYSLLPELSVGRTAAPCSSVGEKQRKESRKQQIEGEEKSKYPKKALLSS
ncbi:hypothetical protein KAJ26_01790, partial [bacterium]|nr:hypothetical protein [bacterium]